MPSVDNLFPSSFLKAADLGSKTWPLVIDRLEIQEMDDGKRKPVVFFEKAEKGLVLNKTNANRIAYALGKDTDGWRGKTIKLHVEPVDFKGDIVDAIRVVMEKPTSSPGDHHPSLSGQQWSEPPIDDEIPW